MTIQQKIRNIVEAALVADGKLEPVYSHNSSIIDASHVAVYLASAGQEQNGALSGYRNDLIRVQVTLNDSTVETMLEYRAVIKNALIKKNLGQKILNSFLNNESEPVPIRAGHDFQWFGIFDVTGCEE